jgi:hypothetical protein
LAVGSGPSRDRTAVVFSLDATGRMGPRTPSQGYVTTYAPNRWYSISLRLDWTAKRLSFFADDRQVATGVPFYGSGVDRLLAVYLYNADATTVGWDGIRFLQAQTPLPVGVTPGTAPRLANGVWNGTVTVPSVAGDAILKAEDDTGHTGESGPFDLHSDRLDTDGDGLPDAWELAWGLDPATPGDATADADQDGLADAREFAAGTSPRDPGSLLRLLPPRLQGDDLILSAVAGAGVRLEVEVSGALGGDWTPAGSAVGAGDPVELRIPGAAATSPRFYRVRVQP